MKYIFTLLILISTLSISLIANDTKADGNIYLPGQISNQIPLTNADLNHWKASTGKKWFGVKDINSGAIHRAFGPSVQINDFSKITESNVESASISFLRDHADAMRINPDNLKLKRAKHVQNKWYVSFVQIYNGYEVLNSEIELRIFENAKVMAWGAQYFSNIDVITKTGLSSKVLMSKASEGLQVKKQSDITLSANKKYILPVRKGNGLDFRFVQKVDIQSTKPFGNFFAYVDAINGELIWRQNRILNASTDIHSSGTVRLKNPLEDPELVNFENQIVEVNGQIYYTDKDGKLNIDITDNKAVKVYLDGKWCSVNYSGKARSVFVDTIKPGEDFNIIWDNSNSHIFERNMFYHGNVVHNYIKGLDESFTGMDYQVQITIEDESQQFPGPNAYWDGESITYVNVADPSAMMAGGPSVLYHEYGHGINQFMYQDNGAEEGMANGSCNEAMADVNCAFILDRPEVGLGIFTDDPLKVIRNIDNTNTYPEDITNESHYDGLILGGAFWDLRELVGLDVAQNLAHFAKYGLPDDPNTGVSFSEWFLEVLIADDDDGDLSNGTPHMTEIITSFNKHKIGSNLYVSSSFEHTAYNDTENTIDPYNLTFKLQGMPIQGGKPSDIKVVWSINDFESLNFADAIETSEGNYSVDIPPVAKGSIVKYYFIAKENLSGEELKIAGKIGSFNPYVFLVGFITIALDDFETYNPEWKVGASFDNATQGVWERDIPNFIGGESMGIVATVQPGEDHTENGEYCFITGNEGDVDNYPDYWLNGITTLTSPTYDIKNLTTPILKYFDWIYYMKILNFPGANWGIMIQFSDNGGSSWKDIDLITESSPEWTKKLYVLENFVNKTNKFKFRILINIQDLGFYPSAIAEMLIDDVEILAAGAPVSVDELAYSNNNIEVFPNPFANSMNIKLNSAINSDIGIYNSMGQLVNSLKSINGNSNWSGRDAGGNELPAGLYIIKVNLNDRTITKQIIKQ